MLRTLKADPNLSDFGKQVKKIRTTQQGESKASASVLAYRGVIEEALKWHRE